MEETEQLAEHNGAKKRTAEYKANYRQAGKDAIATIAAKPEGGRSTEEAEKLVEHNDKKKKRKKKEQEEIQRYGVGTKEGDEYANGFVSRLMTKCISKEGLVEKLRTKTSRTKLIAFIQDNSLGVPMKKTAWPAIKKELIKRLASHGKLELFSKPRPTKKVKPAAIDDRKPAAIEPAAKKGPGPKSKKSVPAKSKKSVPSKSKKSVMTKTAVPARIVHCKPKDSI